MKESVGKSFRGPSGRMLSRADMSLLNDLELNGTIAWSNEEITFNSGFKSHVYVRMRNDLALNPLLLLRVCTAIKDKVDTLPLTHGKQRCLIGIPTAGYQLAQGVSQLSVNEYIVRGLDLVNRETCFSFMQTAPKNHGRDQTLIDRPDLLRHSYMTVENIISTAKAMLEAFGNLESAGYPTREMHHVVFADWELGGTEALQRAGYDNVHTRFIMRDVMAAYVHCGLWPRERYDEMDWRIITWRKEHG